MAVTATLTLEVTDHTTGVRHVYQETVEAPEGWASAITRDDAYNQLVELVGIRADALT